MKKNIITPELIIEIVRNYYDVNDDLFYITRRRIYVEPRQLCQYFIKKYCKKLSLREIGEFFKNPNTAKPLDHATVIHSLKTVENLIFYELNYKIKVNYLDDLICKNTIGYLDYLKKKREKLDKKIDELELEEIKKLEVA